MILLYYLVAVILGAMGASSFILFVRALTMDNAGTPQARELLFGLVLLGVAFKSYGKARGLRTTRALRRR